MRTSTNNFHANFLANMVPAQLHSPIDFDVLFKMRPDALGPVPGRAVELLLIAFYLGYFGMAVRRLGGREKTFAAKAAVCVVLFVLGQTISWCDTSRSRTGTITGPSLPSSTPCSSARCLPPERGGSGWPANSCSSCCSVIQVANFAAVERPVRAFYDQWTFAVFRGDYPNLTLALTTSNANVFAIWRAQKSGRFSDVRHWDRIPVQSAWLLREIIVWNWTDGRTPTREARGLARAAQAYRHEHGCYPAWTAAGAMPAGLAPYVKRSWPPGYHYLALDQHRQGAGSRSTAYYIGVASDLLGPSEFSEAAWIVHDKPVPVC